MRKMQEKTFTISGTYKEKGADKKFTKEITAVNEGYAKEKALSQIGSKHGTQRNAIAITSVAEKKG